MKQKVKAWAFMATVDGGKLYFITDEGDTAEIHLKKPKPINNPFDYGRGIEKWKPTELTINLNI